MYTVHKWVWIHKEISICHFPTVQVQLQRGMYMYRCAHCTHTMVDRADQTAFGPPHFNQDDKFMCIRRLEVQGEHATLHTLWDIGLIDKGTKI